MEKDHDKNNVLNFEGFRNPDPSSLTAPAGGQRGEEEKTEAEKAGELGKYPMPAEVRSRGRAKEVWHRLLPDLLNQGKMKTDYLDAFARLCILTHEWYELTEDIEGSSKETQKRTFVVTGRNGRQIKSHPLVYQRSETHKELRVLSGQFGLAPKDEKELTNGAAQGDLFERMDDELNASPS